jgi:hypothetical protein
VLHRCCTCNAHATITPPPARQTRQASSSRIHSHRLHEIVVDASLYPRPSSSFLSPLAIYPKVYTLVVSLSNQGSFTVTVGARESFPPPNLTENPRHLVAPGVIMSVSRVLLCCEPISLEEVRFSLTLCSPNRGELGTEQNLLASFYSLGSFVVIRLKSDNLLEILF